MRAPVPVPSAESAEFWRAAAEGRLCLPYCAGCDTALFPPAPRCPTCLDDALDWRDVSRVATLTEWSRVHIDGPSGPARPFTVARALLDGVPGAGLIATLDDAVAPAAGLRLAVAFEPVESVSGPRLALPYLRLPA